MGNLKDELIELVERAARDELIELVERASLAALVEPASLGELEDLSR